MFPKFLEKNRFDTAILENLRQYIYVFKENKLPNSKRDFGKLSKISETFQKCYLGNQTTDASFLNLFNDPEGDYIERVRSVVG